MKLQPQCAICLLQWVYERGAVAENHNRLFPSVKQMLSTAREQVSPEANIAFVSNKLVECLWDTNGSPSFEYYRNLKKKNNENAAKLLEKANNFILEGDTTQDRLYKSCSVATAGNVAPLGMPTKGFNFDEVTDVLNKKLKITLKGNLYKTFKKASNVLYVTDNAGEIGFDSLLISQLKDMGCSVTLLVKQAMFFEDATMEDVYFFGLDKLVNKVITVKGMFVPEASSTSPAMDAFENADLIIAKGTGNYEALQGETKDKPIVFMLKIKCAPIANSTGMDVGQFIIAAEN